MELFKNANFDFLGKKWPFIGISVFLLAASIVSLTVKGGPRYGIDFKGGALVYVKFLNQPPQDRVRSALGAKLPGGAPEIQEVKGSNELIIGTDVRDQSALDAVRKTIVDTLASTFGQSGGKIDLNNTSQQALADRLRDPLQRNNVPLSEEQLQALVRSILAFRDQPPQSGLIANVSDLARVPGVTPQVLAALGQEAYPAPYAIRNVELVGPKIGDELRQQALLTVLSALAGMLVYIAFRFEWIYGVAAVLAVFHDTLITLGLFSILDKEVSLTVIAALLTLVGYSMNDTIVIFDRIRENLKLNRRQPLEQLINTSVNHTLSRTILTSGLTLLTALALWIFGGQVLNGFSFALVVGIVIGTYSTVFIASPILVFWHDFMEKRKAARSSASRAGAVRRAPVKTVK